MEEEITNAFEDQLSLFRSWLSLRRLNDSTLELLQSILVSGDVVSLDAARSALRTVLGGEVTVVLEEASSKPAQEKLRVLSFFVCAFALAGDAEKCLALKYEALLLRQDACTKSPWLEVSYDEWMALAQDSFDNEFYSITAKCYDSAFSCIPSTIAVDTKGNLCQLQESELEKARRLRDAALALSASQSVQAQTSKYLRKKKVEQIRHEEFSTDIGSTASSKFRKGVNRRNTLKLRAMQLHTIN